VNAVTAEGDGDPRISNCWIRDRPHDAGIRSRLSRERIDLSFCDSVGGLVTPVCGRNRGRRRASVIDRQAYYRVSAKQLRAWKILSALLVAPCAAWAIPYFQAELSLPSGKERLKAEAMVVSHEPTKIWGGGTRTLLHLKLLDREAPAVSVLMTLSEDNIPTTVPVVFSSARRERVFVVGDYPYWPYSIAFGVLPFVLFLAARHFEVKYRRLAEQPPAKAEH